MARKFNTKMCVYKEKTGSPLLRIWWVPARKDRKKFMSGYYRVKCGDCNGKVTICPGDKECPMIEIGGVNASAEEWRRLLIPILNLRKP